MFQDFELIFQTGLFLCKTGTAHSRVDYLYHDTPGPFPFLVGGLTPEPALPESVPVGGLTFEPALSEFGLPGEGPLSATPAWAMEVRVMRARRVVVKMDCS